MFDLFLGTLWFNVIIHGTFKKYFKIVVYIERYTWLFYIDILSKKIAKLLFF